MITGMSDRTDRTDRQLLPRKGKRLRIFIGEAQEWQGKPLYQAILELVQRQGTAGATVLRGIEGFGPEHHLSTDRLPDISENLPLIVEIVDSEEHIEAILPWLERIVQRGMITLAPVEIVYDGRTP
jgi:PII-like signaling protein